jgi:quercetin dioxygenase-like cupin family protein
VGCRLPRHTDSAEETVVVCGGQGIIEIGGERAELHPGAIALVPATQPHEVRNGGDQPLQFVAVYAGTDVVTTYEADVQPDGSRERRPLG